MDWQVTTCFYAALHLMNGHLSSFGVFHATHVQMDNALNPYILTSPTKLPEDAYVAYRSLSDLSRRSRYLVQVTGGKVIESDRPALIHSVHLARAIRHLDTVIGFYCKAHNAKFDSIKVRCVDLKSSENFNYFAIQ
ncbi:hypothetical protein J2Y45_002107 [Dyadobacter sp. BE34]|uniref:Uncharacterized protein n=1 Tax=Dyadobacter fermentans TaxID=94254 RepID=A0ABU1QY38_9BACT|nr:MULTISPECIES: hypothetical protein [Dyadobacter]MDR6805584.1 hypothetical protein [Dyadobacter fermentans]MDR7042656.1 hypothetical protein [Dyadobacter sp. BE242]MDR7196968.1 hypothetical protein [Dyadobacter sp. BE34]MDR7215597.1 hypothetical protein [Dyadobacter sp. BE31]MDR7263133.1 hypothetical protein [Dyadobacter sp. BE32]